MLFIVLALSTGIISLDKDYSVHYTIDKLNDEIEFTEGFEEKEWGWGWGLLVVEKNIAMNIKMLKGKEEINLSSDSLLMELSFDSKLLEFGYGFNLSRLIFYLSGGGGYSSVNLSSIKQSEIVDFSPSLSNPEGSVNYRGSSFVLSASSGVFLAVSDYLAGGVSAGYVYSLRTPRLVLDGTEEIEIQNAPEMPLHQWYVKFSVGIGDFQGL
ncbi:MAG: hypothetical protein P8Y62_07535 [candidate division WOR-3 bacterium]|jgi:hypothetical protein